ncbi:hypothetical protein ACFOEY_19600 [Paracandidimonas soli]|uniref:hypothetical protein n=1 Tax=Paracandidimonas soli TaxID=1917182 RepID=UPI00361B40C1
MVADPACASWCINPPVAHAVRGRPSHTWAYKDSAGAILGYIHRFNTSDGGKEVLPCVYAQDSTGRRDWRWMQFPVPRPLYGLHDMSGRDYVLVVEGEKCRDAAAAAFSHVYDVVSWPGGGKAVSKADWSPLAGRKVIIWPDCDAKVDKISGDLLPEMPEKGRQTQRASRPPRMSQISCWGSVASSGSSRCLRQARLPTGGMWSMHWTMAGPRTSCWPGFVRT